MKKKAILSYDIFMFGFIKLILLATIVVFVMFVVYLLVVNDVGVERLRAQIFVERVSSSPDCFPYYNEKIDRYYPNIIDFTEFEKETLEKCIDHGDKKFISAKLILENLDKPKELDKNPKTLFYNEDEYKKWLPFSFDERYYLKVNKQRYVLIRENDKLYRGKLQIEVVTPAG